MKKIKHFFEDFGNYLLLMKDVFRWPQNMHIFKRKLMFEIQTLGIDSILIVLLVSVFVGAAVVIQL